MIEKRDNDQTSDEQLDASLLKHFETMTDEFGDPLAASSISKLQDVLRLMASRFHKVGNDALLECYTCTIEFDHGIFKKGKLCIGRNNLYFMEIIDGKPSEGDNIRIAYREVNLLSMIPAKRVLAADLLQIGFKDTVYRIILFFNRSEVFQILCALCNAAMNRLVKGAENSLIASSELFSKTNSNFGGDLSSNSTNKTGGLLMLKSKEEFGMDESMGESSMPSPSVKPALPKIKPKSTNEIPEASYEAQIVRYSQIKTSVINSLADLYSQTRNVAYRNLFRLSHLESILSEEERCHFYLKSANTFHTGTLFLSKNFVSFSSWNTHLAGQVLISNNVSSTATLTDSKSDPILVFTIPYSHIVSITNQPPTALTFATNLTISLSGYLLLATKNRMEFWLSFGGGKIRDRVRNDILLNIKSVDWQFDGDVIIGGRNGPIIERKVSSSSLAAGSRMSEVSLDSPTMSPASAGEVAPDGNLIFDTGLQFIYPVIGRDGNEEYDRTTQADLNKWTEYFDTRGRDVCIVKEFQKLRSLLSNTNGLPDIYRGDFWMLTSGAWYSKPPSGYYESLLKVNENKRNPFREEIEKDVQRFQ